MKKEMITFNTTNGSENLISKNGSENLISKSSSKFTMHSSITAVGSGTELPIEITADFENIPQHLHVHYIDAMKTSFRAVNLYVNV
jgi:hypothetical protein